MKKLNLSAPWHIHQKKLAEMFALDEDVTVGDVTECDGGYAVAVSVSNHAKARALSSLLKPSVDCGNVTLYVSVTDTAEDSMTELLKDAFAHNRLIRRVETVSNPTVGERTFIVMEPGLSQFWADNLSDYRGNVTMLASDAARDLFCSNIVFCTADLTEN